MPRIISYEKIITQETTKQLDLPESATELCTIDGVTYVSVPDDVEIADNQPVTYQTVVMTDELRELIKSQSTHVQLIDERVKAKIAERYSITDEIKQLRSAPSDEFDVYAEYAESCRTWGQEQKSMLGL